MIVTYAAVYQNREGETLLRHDGETAGEPVYDLPYMQVERHGCQRASPQVWAELGSEDQISFSPVQLLAGITLRSTLYYQVQPRSLAPIAHSPEGRWRFSNLGARDAQIGQLVLGPFAQRLRWYMQNEGQLLSYAD